jgi:N-acetylmuramate 1-kinase
VPVHLDYHSRNLMLPADGLPLAVIDFQDAVLGPPTYDLASLLYDCYQDYLESERVLWSQRFYASLPDSIRQAFADADDWHRKLRMTALQRHIKAIGIFARLAHRDGKHQFLDEIPLTRHHLLEEMAALSMREEDYPLLFVGT